MIKKIGNLSHPRLNCRFASFSSLRNSNKFQLEVAIRSVQKNIFALPFWVFRKFEESQLNERKAEVSDI